MRILIDTSPITNAHAIRGIGMYTRILAAYLDSLEDTTVIRSATLAKDEQIEIDLIHYPFYDFFFDTLPLVKRAPTVVTIHDVIPLKYPKVYTPGLKGYFRSKKQQFALRNVNAVITDSVHSKNDIMKYLGIPSFKIHVVPLAANPELEHVGRVKVSQIREKYSLPNTYILYVGDINYNKNIPQLIKSLKYLPEHIQLVCVGKNFTQQEIPEWQKIEQQIALSNVSDRIIFLSQIFGGANADLSAIYSGAKAYVQPSIDEGFGLPILEAMICETPVVCTKLGSLNEVAGIYAEYSNGETAEELAAAILKIVELNPEERKRTTDKAKLWAKQFSWEKTAMDTRAVYEKILGEIR